MDKQKWSLVGSAGLGAGLGAGLMYLLDPQGGRGRRAVARDKSLSTLKKGSTAAAKTSRHLGNKTKGLVAQAGSKLRRGEADLNGALLKKVQKKVRGAVSHPHAIEPAVEDGRVILRGLVLSSELDGLLAVIQAVEGCLGVDNQLKVHESAQDLAAYKSGKRWVGPATRVLTGTTGSALALAGLKRRDGLGAALGAVGLGLLAHGMANPDVKGLAGKLRRSKSESPDAQDSLESSDLSGNSGLQETAHPEPLHQHRDPMLEPTF
jgi:hypothetical protein